MHEQSETYGDNGQYYVGYGRGTGVPGERLPGSPTFPTPEAAEPWAVQRSKNSPRDAEQPLQIQRAWERAAGGGTSPMQVKPKPEDEIGATPLSWNSGPSVESALQEAQRSAYSPFKAPIEAAKNYAIQRAQQAHGMVSQPWHSQAGIGTAMPEAAQSAIIVPQAGGFGPGAFSKTELQAQKMIHNMNPELLRAAQNDVRPGGVYTLDRDLAARGQKGYTQYSKDSLTGQQVGPIDVRLGPKPGPETGIHEFNHAFNYRRGGQGTTPNTGGFDILPQDAQDFYMRLAGGDKEHAAVYARADRAAHQRGLSPTPHPSFK